MIKAGTVHAVPADLRQALTADPKALVAWNDLTPLARNEWVCWVAYVKKAETRHNHIVRSIADLKAGKRRPCCWMGCPHHNPNAKKYFDRRQTSPKRAVLTKS